MAKAKRKAPAKQATTKATGIEERLANIDVQLKTKVRAVAESGYYKRTWDVWFAIKYAGQVSLGT